MPSTTIYANKGTRVARRSSDGWEAGAGASDFLPSGLYSGYLYRTLLGFSYSFTGWTSISSATLNLRTSTQFYVAFGSDPDIEVRRVTSSWSEGSSSDLSSSNSTTYGNQPNSTTSGSVERDISTSEQDWVTVNITEIMQAALAAGVFYGLSIRAVDESSSTDVTEFYSDDTSSKPYIEITYSTNTAPNAPTGLTPGSDSIVNTLTPTLAGTFSDPDDGDSLSGIQIQVYEDDGTTVKWDTGTVSAAGATFSKVYSGPALTGNTFYRWRARTKDTAGAWGSWSGHERFKANSTPTAPTVAMDGTPSDEVTLTPTLFITHVDPDATDQDLLGYRVVVYRTSDSSVMWDTNDVSTSATRTLSLPYAGAALSWQTDYFFKARTKDSNGAWGPYSASFAFATHTAGIPTSLAPTGGAVTGSVTPTFTGVRSKTNDSLTAVEIEVYESDGTTLKWSSGSIATGSPTGFSTIYAGSALTGSADYKWRARVTSSVGGTSAWSTLQTFQAPDTNAPTTTSPVGTGIADLTPNMTIDRSIAFIDHEIEVYEADGTTLLWTSAPSTYASTTSKTVTYAGPALDWATEYKWRARVSVDGSVFSTWSGLASFETDKAGIPTLTNPSDGEWETTTTPNFQGTTEASETIDTFRIILTDSAGTEVWDSGDIAGSGTTFSKTYDGGSTLVPGATYYWRASYVSGGVPGEFCVPQYFHINASPSTPLSLSPAAGAVVADDLTPDFYATFADLDVVAWGDTPSKYEVEVYRVSDDTLMHTLEKTASLTASQNSTARAAEGTALSYEVEYSWRARYTDSKGAIGPWSTLRVFKPSESPTATIVTPVATLTAPAFTVDWDFSSPSSKAQAQYRVIVQRDEDGVVVYDTGLVASADTAWEMPAGYLLNGVTYDFTVYAYDSDGLVDTDTVTSLADWEAPPAPANFSAAVDPSTSAVILTWDASTLDAEDFAYYSVYRRVVGDESWTPYADITNQSTTTLVDRLAANGVLYDYRVTQLQHVPGDVDLESEEESVASAILDADEWFVIGADGTDDHSFELPVYSEAHQKPVQQEMFEPLGSTRKKSARGNVLGNEGTLDMTFTKDEREDAKRRLGYLADNAGPHILKSPFGDVWQVEFSGPQFKYNGAGHMSVTIAWVEVA